MKITGGRIAKFLSAPPDDLCGVLLFGPNRGLAKERSEILMRAFAPGADTAFSTTVLTADDLSSDPARLSDEMSALSLLGDQRLVRIRLDHERSGAAIAKIIRNLDSNPDTCAARLVIEAGDMTPRSAVRKAFEAAGHFAAIGCYPDSSADLANLVRRALHDSAITIEPTALDMWLPLLEGDRALARGEIDKMIVFKGAGDTPGAVVNCDDIRQVTSGAGSASLDTIIMSAMSGKTVECDQAYRQAIASKTSAAVILFSLQRHISRLLEASAHVQGGERAESAIRALRPPVFRMQERAFIHQLRLWPSTALARTLSQTLTVETQLKSAGSPGESLVGRLLQAIASYASKLN